MIHKTSDQDSVVQEDNNKTSIKIWNKTDHKNSSTKRRDNNKDSIKIKEGDSQLLTPREKTVAA